MRARDQLNSVRWQDIPGPEDYDPSAVIPALLSIGSVTDMNSLNETSNRCLYALGNNHRGTLFPAAIWAVPFLAWYAVEGRGWVRFAALDILTDAMCFDADGEFPEVEVGDGTRVTLQQGVRDALRVDIDALLSILGDENEYDETRAVALHTLVLLNAERSRIRDRLDGVVVGERRPRLTTGAAARRTLDQLVAEWRAMNPK
jgi:hypothetical protein